MLIKFIIVLVSALALYVIIHFKIVSKRNKGEIEPVKKKKIITVWDIWEDL